MLFVSLVINYANAGLTLARPASPQICGRAPRELNLTNTDGAREGQPVIRASRPLNQCGGKWPITAHMRDNRPNILCTARLVKGLLELVCGYRTENTEPYAEG
jgi:hypothetical protein